MEAIVVSTRRSAELLGLADRIGTIETGKEADLVVVDGDPLADIALLREPASIALVFKGGKLAHIGSSLEEIARTLPGDERLS